jgi:DNA-directed RNA polymerase subunit M/transcription elongation factor TFIIS
MKFCEKCDNMYYICIDQTNTNKLSYYCRNCAHVDNSSVQDGVCVLNTDFTKGEQKFNHIINKYTKMDPTLPRMYNVKCPNDKCNSNTDEKFKGPLEVIYIRYDNDKMKYLYMCTDCDTKWTNETNTQIVS